MIISYRHACDPETTKTYDTEKSFKKLKETGFYHGQTQQEWDEFEIKKFKRDKENGLILDFKFTEE